MIGDLAALPQAFLRTLWLRRKLMTRDAIEAHQAAGIRRLLAHAARSTSFYAPFAEAALADLPIVDKATQLARFDAFNTQGLDAARAWQIIGGLQAMAGLEFNCSTGTSGTRGLYIISRAERFRWLGTMLAKLLPDVLTRRHKVAIVLPGPSPLYQSANESRLVTLAHFDARRGVVALQPEIEAFAPSVFLAAPKTLRGLAVTNARIEPRKIFAAAEVLDPSDRAIIERAFGVTLGQVYMATEGLLGTSCRHGHLHLAEDIVAFELEPIGDDPTLVTPLFTDFTRRTQIMARYRLGDLLRIVAGACSCGSAMRRVRVIGRRDDLIALPAKSGSKPIVLAPDRLCETVTSAAIDDYRIGLGEAGRCLRVLLPRHAGPEAMAAALRALESLLENQGADARVEIMPADLVAPFDRKLRRIAPVAPESL